MPIHSAVGTLIRKTSLLRTVPTACGQAADKIDPVRDFKSRPELGVSARTRLSSRPMLGAILPLHDVRYHSDIGSTYPYWTDIARLRRAWRPDGERAIVIITDEQAR
jgi:hypothetical protein